MKLSLQQKLKQSLPPTPETATVTMDMQIYELYRTSGLSLRQIGDYYGINLWRVRNKIRRIKSWLERQQQ